MHPIPDRTGIKEAGNDEFPGLIVFLNHEALLFEMVDRQLPHSTTKFVNRDGPSQEMLPPEEAKQSSA